jgi:hypothetical protein
MPTATIPRAITAQEAADALRDQLGSGYRVTPHDSGSLTGAAGHMSRPPLTAQSCPVM